MRPLDAALLAGGAAAFAGALVGVLALSGKLSLEAKTPGAPHPTMESRLSLGSFLLASHALAAATLWQAPTVGACMAAALGAGWIASAAAGLVVLMSKTDRVSRRSLAIALRAAVGFALLSPLWAYVQVMRLHALPGVTA
jgi:hypothetical protein